MGRTWYLHDVDRIRTVTSNGPHEAGVRVKNTEVLKPLYGKVMERLQQVCDLGRATVILPAVLSRGNG